MNSESNLDESTISNSENDPEIEASRAYLIASAGQISTVPPRVEETQDLSTRIAAFGVLGGMANYLVLHSIPHALTSGNKDEISALLTMVAAAFIGSMHRSFAQLCFREKNARDREKNIYGGAGGGVLFGLGIVAALPVVGIATVPILIASGIVLGVGGIGAVSGAAFNRILKRKWCPHCGHKGKCDQIVCRNCKRIFYPVEISLDCQKKYLSGAEVASILQGRGLSYLDVEILVQKHFSDWERSNTSKIVLVDCKSFRSWLNDNEDKIIENFIDSGLRNKSKWEIALNLDELDRTAKAHRLLR
jgi:hypothetical protein